MEGLVAWRHTLSELYQMIDSYHDLLSCGSHLRLLSQHRPRLLYLVPARLTRYRGSQLAASGLCVPRDDDDVSIETRDWQPKPKLNRNKRLQVPSLLYFIPRIFYLVRTSSNSILPLSFITPSLPAVKLLVLARRYQSSLAI